ncbi:nitronate monooxygenase [bacterium]|nr:MAG: nitronate monooxygenase [bacterium]
MSMLLNRLDITLPIIQAPMAGVSTPQLAAAVSNAGALGSIAVGASKADEARAMIAQVRAATDRAFNVNLFVHAAPQSDPLREANWLQGLAATFHSFGSAPPASLRAIYKSFDEDDEMLTALIEAAPPVLSFHFGLPKAERIAKLKATGALLLASVTSLDEGLAAQRAGVDAVVAQGFEAGGHRGIFDPTAFDDCLSTLVLTRLLVQKLEIPVIAAGGIMDGQGIAAALKVGAIAAQLGTAFIACPETSANPAYRAALLDSENVHTVMTTAISGRPARCLVNRFTALGEQLAHLPRPDYPIAYDAGKALHAAASAKGEFGYGAQWAGQGAALARALPARELIETLVGEMEAARRF